MIVFIQPMFSKAELNSDSNYVFCTAFMRAVWRERPDWYFVMPWPDAKSGFKYEDDGFFRNRNILRVSQRISPRKMANVMAYNPEWYDALFRRIGFDVVVNNLVEIQGQLKQAGECPYDPSGRPLLIGLHHYVIHSSLPYPPEVLEPVKLAQLTGALSSDINVFNTDYTRRMFVDNLLDYTNSRIQKRISDTARIINYGTLEPDLEPVMHVDGPPTIIYNHRLQEYKDYKTTFALLDEIHGEGIDFRLAFLNTTAEKAKRVLQYPWAEILITGTREKYLSYLRHGSLNVTNTKYETFCVSAVESMALGQPLVAPRGLTFPEITPPGYPYLFNDVDEQRAMLRRLLTDREERQKWGHKCHDFVMREFSWEPWARQWVALIESNVKKPNPAADAMEWVRSCLEQVGEIEIRKFYRMVAHKQVNGRIPFANQSLSLTKLNRMVRKLGGEAVLTTSGEHTVYAPGYQRKVA